MAQQFEGKVALITGAASAGIGRATAVAFAQAGAKVAVADVEQAGGEETVRQIEAAGGEAVFIPTDVSQAAEVAALVEQTVIAFGRLDYAFNNAGIEGVFAPLTDIPEETWERVLNVNLKGIWLCLKYEIPQILKQGGGAIVNAASVAGLVGVTDLAPYVASKHGVAGLTKTAALEVAGRGIRINAVCPGTIDTPMVARATGGDPVAYEQANAAHPLGRIGRPEEVAGVVLWLCSDAASFVTGHLMTVDGGYVAR